MVVPSPILPWYVIVMRSSVIQYHIDSKVDFECKTVVDIVVKPAEPVVSCLTPLTNLTPEVGVATFV